MNRLCVVLCLLKFNDFEFFWKYETPVFSRCSWVYYFSEQNLPTSCHPRSLFSLSSDTLKWVFCIWYNFSPRIASDPCLTRHMSSSNLFNLYLERNLLSYHVFLLTTWVARYPSFPTSGDWSNFFIGSNYLFFLYFVNNILFFLIFNILDKIFYIWTWFSMYRH